MHVHFSCSIERTCNFLRFPGESLLAFSKTILPRYALMKRNSTLHITLGQICCPIASVFRVTIKTGSRSILDGSNRTTVAQVPAFSARNCRISSSCQDFGERSSRMYIRLGIRARVLASTKEEKVQVEMKRREFIPDPSAVVRTP